MSQKTVVLKTPRFRLIPAVNGTAPEDAAVDAELQGQMALIDMITIWSGICKGSAAKKPSHELAYLLAQEFATRLECYVSTFPADHRVALAAEVIFGLLYEWMRPETDFMTA